MPQPSRFFVRSSFAYLVAGFSFGGLILLQKGGLLPQRAWLLLPAHIELLLVGWIAQLAMGVAWWILPRYAPTDPRGRAIRPRGDERPVWLAFALLNMGVLLAAFAGLAGLPPSARLLGRLGVALSVALFAFAAWGRVKPVGR